MVVMHASAKPALEKSESGYWIAQAGANGNEQSVISKLKLLAKRHEPCNVIWIIPAQFVDTLTDPKQFVSRVFFLLKEAGGEVRFTAVVPGALARHEQIMTRLQEVGLSLHYAADDGACFVEVHKPEGIVVGMTGPAFRQL